MSVSYDVVMRGQHMNDVETSCEAHIVRASCALSRLSEAWTSAGQNNRAKLMHAVRIELSGG